MRRVEGNLLAIQRNLNKIKKFNLVVLPGMNSWSQPCHCCSAKSQWPAPSRSVRDVCRHTEGMIITLISDEVKRAIKPFYSAITGSSRMHYPEQWLSQQGGCVDGDPGRQHTLSPQFSYLGIKYLVSSAPSAVAADIQGS